MSTVDTPTKRRDFVMTKRGWIILAAISAILMLSQVHGLRYTYHAMGSANALYRIDRITGKIVVCRTTSFASPVNCSK